MDDSSLEWERIKGCKAVVPRHVVLRAFASETVLLNVQTGYYYGMDEIGARFFETLRKSQNVASAVHILVKEFEQPAQRIREDTMHYCSELEKLGLIELIEAPERDRTSH